MDLSTTEEQAIGPVDPPSDYDQLQRQVEELTTQLNQSQLAEQYANRERDKYVQFYNETNEHFLAIEHRLSNFLTSHQTSTSVSSIPLDKRNTSINRDDVLRQISVLMNALENFSSQCSEQTNQLHLSNSQKQEENEKLQSDLSSLQVEYEKERQKRQHFEQQFKETNKLIELDHSKRLQKLRNYASLADDEGDILLSSLMKKAEKNDVDFREMQLQYENNFNEQVNEMKKLVKERELMHLYIERLERENTLLTARTNSDETIRSLTYSSQKPTSYEECLSLIEQLREVIIEELKIQDKLKNDQEQLKANHQTDIREREQIDEVLTRDLNAAKDQILVLESVRSEYEHAVMIKNNLQREIEDYQEQLSTMRTVTNALINHVKEQTEEISLEKERLEEENVILRDQIQQLKVDFGNSESVQHDFVKLSQALQVQLEEFRNSENDLRWQHEEDYSECQRCHLQFSVTWRKQHCHHCGKVLCKECVNKTVVSGPNNRPSRVCNVCYTLLNKTSQPYFLQDVPKV